MASFSRTAWPKPNIAIVGYAFSLAISATSLWSGVFPFFPDEFHTLDTTFAFAMAESLAYFGALLGTMVAVWHFPTITRKTLVLAAAITLFLGAFCLIGALYLPGIKMHLIIAGAILLGMGGAGFGIARQRYFSSLESDRCNYLLLMGGLVSPAVYATTFIVPTAMTVYLVPLVLMPLCALCLVLKTREIDYSLPYFTDAPRDHPRVYRQMMTDHWRGVVAVGSLGFAAGTVRAAAVNDVAMGMATNTASVIGGAVASLALLVVWRRRGLRFGLEGIFLMLLPFAAIALFVFPTFASDQLFLLAGFFYLVYSGASQVMLLQCAQVSRDRGISPIFVFGFFEAIVNLLNEAGFFYGHTLGMTPDGAFDMGRLASASMFVILMAFFLLRVGNKDFRNVTGTSREDAAELLPLATVQPQSVENEGGAPKRRVTGAGARRSETQPHRGRDRLSVMCGVLKDEFRLTNRETEILEAIARGYTVARIAEHFTISENTVRTHAKHIYAKLGIHKREEILDMIDEREEKA